MRRRWIAAPLLFVAACGGGSGHTLRGEFTLTDTDRVLGGYQSCSGSGGYDDFGPGMDVTVRDGDGSIIASTSTHALNDEHFQAVADEPDLLALATLLHGRADDIELGAPTDVESLRHRYESTFRAVGCTVVFSVDLPDSDFYAVEIGSRGEQTYSRDELEADLYFLSLTLG